MSVDLTIMSSKELAETLRTIPVSEWNAAVDAARVKQAGWIANLRFANLLDADLRHADLHRANLRYADLRSADLRHASLRHASLHSADLHSANLRNANLHSADLHSADLHSANLRNANLHSADLHSANLRHAHNDGTPLTIDQWCDIFHMPSVGKGLRVGFKRLPADRITGRDHNNGKNLVEWKNNRWVEAPDWNESAECGGGLHISPTAAMTRTYSGEPLCIAVSFDPKDAVCLGDKLKVRKLKVIG